MSGQTEYITKGSSQFSTVVNLLQDNSGTNPGDPLTGLVYNSASLVCYYKSGGTGAATQLTLATQTSTGAFSLGGFAQISSANMPGAYRLDLSTTLFSSGDNFGQVMLSGYADLAAHSVHVKFTDLDLYQSMSNALSTYGASTLGSTEVDDSLNTYGASTHTSTDITDALNTYGGSTHTSTDITDVLTSYGVSTLSSTSTILLSTAATSPQLVDDIMDEVITGATHNVNNSLAKFVREGSQSGVLLSGTANSGTASTVVLSSGAITNDGMLDGERIAIIDGTGVGQSRLIQSSSATSDTVTVETNWVVNPDATSVYVIQGAEAEVRAIGGQPVSATATVNFDNLSTLTSTDINDQVLDVISTDTFSLPGQEAPTATPTIQEAISYLYKFLRNKKDNDGSTTQIYADDGSTVDHTQTTTVSSGVVTKGEIGSGP